MKAMGRRKRKPPRRRTITNSARAEFSSPENPTLMKIAAGIDDSADLSPSLDAEEVSAAMALAFDDDPITAAIRIILKKYCKPYGDDRKLKNMGAGDAGVRILIAHEIDHDFPDLNPQFTPEDISSDDTLGTLATRVAGRFTA
jgi:hypothetical protein